MTLSARRIRKMKDWKSNSTKISRKKKNRKKPKRRKIRFNSNRLRMAYKPKTNKPNLSRHKKKLMSKSHNPKCRNQ